MARSAFSFLTRRHWTALTIARLILAYAVLAGLPRVLLAHRLGLLPGGWVNLECLVIGALGLFLPRGAVFPLLVLDLAADFIYGICSTYQFSVAELLESLRSLSAMPRAHLAEMVVAVLLLLGISAGVTLLGRVDENRVVEAACLLGLGAILLFAAIVGGQSRLRHYDVADGSRHLVRTPLVSLALREQFLRKVQDRALHPDTAVAESATARLQTALGSADGPQPDVVLVLLESWGVALDESFAQGIASPYDDPGVAARYRVSRGQTPFEGSTVAAGARELCHSRMGFGILRIAPAQAAHCLPAWFHARGYEDLSVHGYSGRMFQRERWHRAIGFDRSWFGEELSADGLPECGGAFPGICDAALGEWIGRDLLTRDASRPRFVYWVTLNSHLPVPSQVDLPPSEVCAQTGGSAPLCSWARLVLEAHRTVARLGLEVTRPTVFLVVGDHAPPFADAGLRRRFSATQVPWVLLEPKPTGYSARSTTMVSSSK